METKERILLGAEELFFKYGIKSITMDDIAKHLAMSKKTIYQFYKDKNELVEMLMAEKLKQDECEFQKIQTESSNMVEEVFNMMKHISLMFSKINVSILFFIMLFYYKFSVFAH